MTKKSKILANNPMEQEYQAKIVATSMALSGFYSEAMNALIAGQEEHGDHFEPAQVLEKLSVDWATKIVDDISPKETLIHV